MNSHSSSDPDVGIEAMVLHGMELKLKVAQYIEEWYGEKCPDYEENCPCCKKHKALNDLFSL